MEKKNILFDYFFYKEGKTNKTIRVKNFAFHYFIFPKMRKS